MPRIRLVRERVGRRHAVQRRRCYGGSPQIRSRSFTGKEGRDESPTTAGEKFSVICDHVAQFHLAEERPREVAEAAGNHERSNRSSREE